MKKLAVLLLLSLCSVFVFAQTINQTVDKKTLAQEEEISVPAVANLPNVQLALSNPDYMVTAGDIYSLTYAAGNTPVNFHIVVDSGYKIKVSNLATLDVSGKSYATVKKQVEEIVQKNYPLSGAQFILTTPAAFTVTVTGEVKETKEQKAWALTRLSEVLNGITTDYASNRKVTVTGLGGKVKTYDLFKAQRSGDLSQDPYVRPGDVITVNRYERRVTVNGAVERPGTYELLKNENLKDLVNFYGNGLAPMADTSRIELTRYTNQNAEYGEKIYLDQKSVDENLALQNLDEVYISSYTQLKPVMFIEGAVLAKEDGSLEVSDRKIITFEENTNYAYLIRNYSAWFTSAAADVENAYIVRRQQIIPLNIADILYDASFYSEETVQPYDKLVVPFKQLFVTVAGAVRNPGRFPYIPDRTADYYIGLAGGYDRTKNAGEAITVVDINGKKLKKDVIIEPETTITARTNAFTYYFNQYAGIVTTIVSVISTTLTIQAYLKK